VSEHEPVIAETEQILKQRRAQRWPSRTRNADLVGGNRGTLGNVQLVVSVNGHQNTFTPRGTL
jgi:hypothetical protein